MTDRNVGSGTGSGSSSVTISTTTLQWSGNGAAITDKAPDVDSIIDATGAKAISIQLRTPSVAAGAATFDCYVIGSPDGLSFDTASTTNAYVYPFNAVAESINTTKAVTPAPFYVKLRLTVNTTNPAVGENTIAVVTLWM